MGVGRLQPGGAGIDHAVGEELDDAAAPQLPADVAQAQLRLDLPRRWSRASATAARAGAGSAPRCPRGRAAGRASRARRPSRARRSGRARSAAAARATWRARISGQRRPGAARSTRSCALVSRSSPVGHAVDADDRRAVREVDRPGHLRQLQRARTRQRRVQVREPDERRRAVDRLADLAAGSAPRRSPAPRRTASRARGGFAASAASTSSRRGAVAQIGPAGELRAPERMDVGVDQSGDQRLAACVQDLGARVAVRADLGLVADGDDRRRAASRRRSRTGLAGSRVRTRAPTMARSAAGTVPTIPGWRSAHPDGGAAAHRARP